MKKQLRTLLLTILMCIICCLITPNKMNNVCAATRSIKHGGTVTIDLGDTINVDGSDVKRRKKDNFPCTYLRFTAKKSGWVRLTSPAFYGEVWLLNDKKVALSKESVLCWDKDLDDEPDEPDDEGGFYYSVNYGVTAGKTYYLRIQNAIAIHRETGITEYELCYPQYTIRTSFKAIKDLGGKTKKKAKNLKKGKQVTGILPVGKKTARWYKIKLKKNQKLKVYMSFWGTGRSYFMIKPTPGKEITRMIYNNNLSNDDNVTKYYYENTKVKIAKSKTKLKKGTTIYIKVYTKKNTNGGVYTLKWK